MTEKKKRGRPRKIDSFKKLKEDFDAAQLPEAEIIEMAERAKNYQGPAMSVPSEKLYPPDNLSKSEKLKWLTEHRNK